MKLKKSLGLLLSASLLLGQISHTATASIPQGYWQYQDPFVAARDSQNYEALLPIALNIEALMVAEPQSTDRSSILYNTYDAMATAYQALMDYPNAILTLEKLIPFANELGFYDAVTIAEKRILQIDPMTQVYVQTQNLWQAPYYGAMYEPQAGAYFGRAREEASIDVLPSESAVSFYVECFKEEISSYDYLISPYDDGQRMIQICLNMPEEATSLYDVTQDSANDYIRRLMTYLSGLQSPVLLRIGGEMNVFSNLPTPEVFKEAYIKVATYAREYAPNVALVFSPNHISVWDVNVEDYYPGDAYVDWVGMSAYTQKYLDPASPNGSTDSEMMFYGTGDYSDPIHNLREIVEMFGDKKPILISESGAGYAHKTYQLNLYDFSNSQLKQLYTYANMVFPQVKTIINFDANVDSDQYYFSMSANSDLLSTYQSVTSNHPTLLQAVGQQPSTIYVKAEEYSDQMDSLLLTSFCSPVGQPNMTVTYYVDEQVVGSSTTIPYNQSISASQLSQGQHGLKITFQGDNGFYDEKNYILTQSGTSSVSIVEGALGYIPDTTPVPDTTPDVSPDSVPENESSSQFADVPDTHWAYPYVEYVVSKGYMSGSNGIFRPDVPAIRGETAETLANFSGEYQDPTAAYTFTDVVGSGYENAIGWCVTQVVMNGIGDGQFGTYDNLTREQFAVTLAAYALKSGVYTAPSNEDMVYLLAFKDNLGISSWAKNAVSWAVSNNLMAGYDGYLTPKGTVTRGEIAAMMYRFHVTFF